MGIAHAGEGAQQLRQAFAPETRAHQQKHHGRVRDAQLGAFARAPLLAQPRMKRVQIHAAIDHAQLGLGQSEMPTQFLLHHVRIADYRAQAGACEHAFFRRQRVPVVGTERDSDALDKARGTLAVDQPLAMHAVTGAIDVAAGYALVRLDQVETLRFDRCADGARKTPVTPHPAEIKRVAA